LIMFMIMDAECKIQNAECFYFFDT